MADIKLAAANCSRSTSVDLPSGSKSFPAGSSTFCWADESATRDDRRVDRRVKGFGLQRLPRQADRPFPRFADRTVRRAGEHRQRQQASPNHAQREMTNAASPATGRSASAACARDSTSLMPVACSVAAVDPPRRRRSGLSGGRRWRHCQPRNCQSVICATRFGKQRLQR
jgi:hypothetical protein